MAKTRIGGAAIMTAVWTVGLGVAAVFMGGPPAPVPASAAATEFSAERAMAHVEAIAARPHPMGSAEHARVKEYLVKALETMGLAVEQQHTTARRSTGAGIRVGRVENILARIPGSATSGAILIASHYDSVPAASGAADDGTGVAALLEAVRALKAGDRLRNDVIVLLSDGEEFGLLGAQAFVDEHPWARDVRLTLNFEARGTSGPAQMFETGPENGAVVRAWAEAVPHPAGSSLTYEVYRRMPNDTDFSVFRRLKTVGLNFAFVGSWQNYHTPHDTPATLDRGSLQHEGAAALALTRRFGALDLDKLRDRDAVYFSLPVVYKAIVYSSAWALPLAIAVVVLWLAAFIWSRSRKETSIGGLLLAVLLVASFGAAAGFLGWRFSRILESVHGRWLPDGNVIQSAPYAALIVSAIVTAWLALYVLLRKKFAPHTLAHGAIVLWAIAAVPAAWYVVGGSYVLLWPAMGAILATVAFAAGGRGGSPGWFRVLLIAVLSVPPALMLWPLASQLFGTMGLAPASGAAIALMTVFALCALAVAAELITEGRRWWPAGVALIVTLACALLGAWFTRYSADRPQQVNVQYVLNADSGDARWTTKVASVEPWVETYVGAHPAQGRPDALVPPWSTPDGIPGFVNGPAPKADVGTPEAVLLATAAADGGRTLSLRVTPARDGHMLSVWTNEALVIDAALDGHPLMVDASPRAAADTAWTLDYVNAPASGGVLTLTLKGSHRLAVAVIDRWTGLPQFPGKTFGPRPASAIQIQMGDVTVVRRSYTF